MLPKLLLNFQRCMINPLDLDTSAIDDTYSPNALCSGISNFRDTDFLDIFATGIFLNRCKYFFAHPCPC